MQIEGRAQERRWRTVSRLTPVAGRADLIALLCWLVGLPPALIPQLAGTGWWTGGMVLLAVGAVVGVIGFLSGIMAGRATQRLNDAMGVEDTEDRRLRLKEERKERKHGSGEPDAGHEA